MIRLDHQLEDRPLNIITKKELQPAAAGPCGRKRGKGGVETAFPIVGDDLAWCPKLETQPLHLTGEEVEKLEDAGLCAVMLTERLEIPSQHDEIPGVSGQPVGVAVGQQRPTIPAAVGEPVAHVIAEHDMPG